MDAQSGLGLLGAVAAIGGVYYAWRAVDQAEVRRSQALFVKERADLRERFGALCEIAADWHLTARPSLERIGRSSLLWEASMRPSTPVPLSSVSLTWQQTPSPVDNLLVRAGRHCLPKESKWQRYQRYSTAMEALARPVLFDNRPSFRLLKADWRAQSRPQLTFSSAYYFDLIDQNEAVAHELAVATHKETGRPPTKRSLPMRQRLARDPLALTSRVVLPSVGTLTIRRTPDGQGTFYLLYRDVGQVATGEGTYGPLPAGMVQPASLSPLAHRQDLDLWRTIMREYNEELLGAPEATGASGSEVDYTRPPYNLLNAALADGSLRVWCFGMGLEPLNLAVCILTIAVFDADTFDSIFANAVDRNDEGIVITGPRTNGTITGLPLTPDSVDDLPAGRVSSPAAGLLQLALQHRDLLLDGTSPSLP
ncbi:transcriptional regulator [Streptomyces sp. NPDC059687]|uniref:transcriptional regulator n=1 Tax=unclassified Streptomyces TaxID=2593676 RepID=UPI003642748F